MDKKRYAGVMVKYNDKILLCKRNNQGSFPGMWSIPGGKMEEGENSQESAKREFFEETNVSIEGKDLKFIGLLPRHTRDGKKVKGMMYVYQLDTDTPIEPDFSSAVDGEEHTDWNYFAKDEIKPQYCGEYLYKLCEIVLQER